MRSTPTHAGRPGSRLQQGADRVVYLECVAGPSNKYYVAAFYRDDTGNLGNVVVEYGKRTARAGKLHTYPSVTEAFFEEKVREKERGGYVIRGLDQSPTLARLLDPAPQAPATTPTVAPQATTTVAPTGNTDSAEELVQKTGLDKGTLKLLGLI